MNTGADTYRPTETATLDGDAEMLEGYKLNNLPLTGKDTSYPIQNLRDFFKQEMRTLDNINGRFPITHLRCVEDSTRIDPIFSRSYYIAYPVKEGGTFLVFLQRIIDGTATNEQHTVSSQSLYINCLPDECNSAVIRTGSTYKEVLEVAPCTILSVVYSTGPRSFSLFSNEKVLVCRYDYGNDQELYVVERTIIPLDISVFANMVLSDLQN